MNKKMTFSIKSLIILLVVIISTVIIITMLPTLISNLTVNSTDDRINAILGILGNISGGLIGAIVAYIVAAYQVSKSQEQTVHSSLKETYVNLLLLLDELEYNQKVFKTVVDSPEEAQSINTHLQKQLTKDQWNRMTPTFASHISNEIFKNICHVYRNIKFIDANPESVDKKYIEICYALLEKTNRQIKDKLNEILNLIN